MEEARERAHLMVPVKRASSRPVDIHKTVESKNRWLRLRVSGNTSAWL